MRIRIAILAVVAAIMGATIFSAASAGPADAASQRHPDPVERFGSTWS